MKIKFASIILVLVSFFYQSNAQVDTTELIIDADTSFVTKKTNNLKRNNPTIATLLSIVPGTGQAYNRQYWKMPIFYGLIGYQTYNFSLKNKNYKKYLNALVEFQKHAKDTSYIAKIPLDLKLKTEDQLTQAKDKYRRSRDLSAVLLLAIYAFNIIDANVYANLSDFDVSEDLTISIKPEIIPTYTIKNQNSIGISVKLRF